MAIMHFHCSGEFRSFLQDFKPISFKTSSITFSQIFRRHAERFFQLFWLIFSRKMLPISDLDEGCAIVLLYCQIEPLVPLD